MRFKALIAAIALLLGTAFPMSAGTPDNQDAGNGGCSLWLCIGHDDTSVQVGPNEIDVYAASWSCTCLQ